MVLLFLLVLGARAAFACSALDPDSLAAFQKPGVPDGLYEKVKHGIPLTLDDVVTLSRADVSRGAIVDYLCSFGRHFRLTQEDVRELREQRLSTDLIDYMTSPAAHPARFVF